MQIDIKAQHVMELKFHIDQLKEMYSGTVSKFCVCMSETAWTCERARAARRKGEREVERQGVKISLFSHI